MEGEYVTNEGVREGSGESHRAVLPGVLDLITDGARFAVRNYQLVLWYLGAFLLLGLAAGLLFGLAFVAGLFSHPLVGGTIVAVLFVGLIVAAMIAGTALTYAATAKEPTRFLTGVRWMWRNFWSFLWVAALSSMVILTGIVLLIIPGIILGVYLYFAQLARMHHGMRGMEALRYSTYLVKENWWGVFGRTVGIMVLYVIVIGVLTGIFTAVFSEDVSDIVMSIISAFGTVFLLRVMSRLYHALAEQKTGFVAGAAPSPAGLYVPFAWIGAVLSVVLPIILLMLAMQNLEEIRAFIEADMSGPDTDLQYQLDTGDISEQEFEAFREAMEAQLQAEIDVAE
jgi:hypothetical protein